MEPLLGPFSEINTIDTSKLLQRDDHCSQSPLTKHVIGSNGPDIYTSHTFTPLPKFPTEHESSAGNGDRHRQCPSTWVNLGDLLRKGGICRQRRKF